MKLERSELLRSIPFAPAHVFRKREIPKKKIRGKKCQGKNCFSIKKFMLLLLLLLRADKFAIQFARWTRRGSVRIWADRRGLRGARGPRGVKVGPGVCVVSLERAQVYNLVTSMMHAGCHKLWRNASDFQVNCFCYSSKKGGVKWETIR